jgi:protein O-GlcNAc transferase
MTTSQPAEILNRALAFHQTGRLAEAQSLYEQLLAQEPQHADALHLLGVLLGQQGDRPAAIGMIGRAIALQPTIASYYNNLANVLKDTGRLDEAIRSYQRAIELDPHNARTIANLADIYLRQAKIGDAISQYENAIKLKSRTAPAQPDTVLAQMHNDLGVALAQAGRLEEASTQLSAASRADPNYPDPYNNLGLVLSQQGRLVDASNSFNEAIRRRPQFPEPYNNLGITLTRQGRAEEALTAYRKSLELQPQNLKTHINLAKTLIMLAELDQAIEASRNVIAFAPNFSPAYQALGSALRDSARLDESIAAFDRAVELDPADASAHSGRIFARLFHPDSAALVHDQNLWNQRHAQPLANQITPHLNNPSPDRPLRIGYISPDFTQHVQSLLMLPLFSNHDQSQFHIHFYSDVINPSSATQRIKECGGQWTSIVGHSHKRVADLIRQDQIDILVDLTMHMHDNRLLVFAHKPAPVQVTWLAYPGSTGLRTIDYRLTDPHLDPTGQFDGLYSERSIYLPDTFWCYDPITNVPAVNELPAISKGFITFGCLNHFCKLNSSTLKLWARLLQLVPNSRLMLLSPPGSARHWVNHKLAEQGIPADRIEHVSRRPRPQYLELFHQIDISLDTLPYNGHTTSLDSLWMGIPVITMPGSAVVGRAGVSELTNLGLTELIASNPDDYIKLAAALASDIDRLKSLRSSLRPKMMQSPLMDGPRFARNVEAAYRDMWRNWCAAQNRQ